MSMIIAVFILGLAIPVYFALVMNDARRLRSKRSLAAAGFAAGTPEYEARLIASDHPAWMDRPFAAPDERAEVAFPFPDQGGLAG